MVTTVNNDGYMQFAEIIDLKYSYHTHTHAHAHTHTVTMEVMETIISLTMVII